VAVAAVSRHPARFPLYRNGLTIFGALLTSAGAGLFLVFLLVEFLGVRSNPYLGLLFLLVCPTLFVAGLLLMPLGVWLEHRRRLAGRVPTAFRWPSLDLNDGGQRRTAFTLAGLTAANLLIVGVAAYSGLEYLDSPEFCGKLCHEVMEPEWAGYQEGAHSRVACVQCHIGPGAPWFVKSKLSGLRQVYAVTFNTHSRPIPSPVTDLRPARDTCEQCHWPEKFHGDVVRSVRTYADDEANTETVTSVRLHIGGINPMRGTASGIHWHVSAANRIEYIASDERRQVIPYVRLDDGRGGVKEFFAEGASAGALPAGERRVLDCIDCHNRPSHTFAYSVARAVDEAMAAGGLDSNLPFVRREVVKVLSGTYPDKAAAFAAIERSLSAFYQGREPAVPAEALSRTIETARRLYARNVFPSMRVTWETYPNNVGHSFPGPSPYAGCFRCHDDSHRTSDGAVISQDCGLCHTIE